MPEGYTTFFSVSAGAGATLLGLIFIAVSISPEKTVGKTASVERTMQADSAFTALVNAFFVSLTALPPTGGIGWGALILSIFALQSTARSALMAFREVHGWLNVMRRLFLVIVGFGIYGFELFASLSLINSPNNPESLATLSSLVSGTYGLGIVRAWELFGVDRAFLIRVFGAIENLRLRIRGPKEETPKEEGELKEETGAEKENPVQGKAPENLIDKVNNKPNP